MSTKDWKNGEINTLLTEKWGFSFNLDALDEASDMPSAGESHTGGTGDRPTEKKAEEDIEGEGGDSKREEEGLDEIAGVTVDSGTRAKPHRAAREEDPCDPSVDPTCAPEPGEAAQKKQIAKKMGTGPRESVLREDSGEDEAWHEWKNEHADDDHIKEIEHHLRALKDDRDYERHGAEYDHDKYEDEGDPMDEGGNADRKDPRNRRETERTRPMQEAELRRLVREALKQVRITNSKKER